MLQQDSWLSEKEENPDGISKERVVIDESVGSVCANFHSVSEVWKYQAMNINLLAPCLGVVSNDKNNRG